MHGNTGEPFHVNIRLHDTDSFFHATQTVWKTFEISTIPVYGRRLPLIV